MVKEGRATNLVWWWPSHPLTDTIPAEIENLSALRHLFLYSYEGLVPPELSNLMSLESLCLADYSDKPSDAVHEFYGKVPAQACFFALFRIPVLRFLNYALAITQKRQTTHSTHPNNFCPPPSITLSSTPSPPTSIALPPSSRPTWTRYTAATNTVSLS